MAFRWWNMWIIGLTSFTSTPSGGAPKRRKATHRRDPGSESGAICEMIEGFALVAWPAEYGSSGIMSFIVNHEGTVYEKNLGKNTESAARAMKAFDPDKSWQKVRAQDLEAPAKGGGA